MLASSLLRSRLERLWHELVNEILRYNDGCGVPGAGCLCCTGELFLEVPEYFVSAARSDGIGTTSDSDNDVGSRQ